MKSPSSHGSKVMAKIKIFKIVTQRSRSQGQNFVSNGKVLSEGIYMENMQALALAVQKLWPKLKFLKSSSKVKVKGHRV